jgi:hypothetical protein
MPLFFHALQGNGSVQEWIRLQRRQGLNGAGRHAFGGNGFGPERQAMQPC